MQTIWETYKTPIVASGIGLCLAFILAVIPLMSSGNGQAAAVQKAQIVSAVQEVSADSVAEIDALKQALAAQARTISDLQNRVANLDRGVTRTFWRSKENNAQLDALSTAAQRITDLETQMSTLNRAVPRISKRVKTLQDSALN